MACCGGRRRRQAITPASGDKITAPAIAENKKYILQTGLPPGDVCTLTAAVYSLKKQFPDYEIDVKTPYAAIWENNPDITPLNGGKLLEVHYPLINKSNHVPATYLHGYTAFLASELRIPLTLQTNRPMLYLAEGEKAGFDLPAKYWLISAGIKTDFTCKAWPVEYYQEVINALSEKITFVQIGNERDMQPELSGCINLVGKTSLRELILLAHECTGGLGPSTLLQHLCAAWFKPYICLLGGREGMPWQASYQTQHTLHTIGQLDCCLTGGCWRSKVVHETDSSLCALPVLDMLRPVAKCMAMIKPAEVIAIIERQLEAPAPSPSKA